MDDLSSRLAEKLQELSETAIDRLRQVLDLPFGTPVSEDNGRLLRAHISAALGALSTQVKVDAMRMRAVREDKALEQLLALIATKELTTPCSVTPDRAAVSNASVQQSQGSALAATTAG